MRSREPFYFGLSVTSRSRSCSRGVRTITEPSPAATVTSLPVTRNAAFAVSIFHPSGIRTVTAASVFSKSACFAINSR